MFLTTISPTVPFEVISNGGNALIAFPVPRYPRPESLQPWANRQLWFVIAKKPSFVGKT
jgi:hypothetical protein